MPRRPIFSQLFVPFLLTLGGCTDGASSRAFSPEIRFGEVEEIYGTAEESPVFFGLVADVELGPSGSLFVLDRQGDRIVHLSRDGKLLGSYGQEGEGPGEFGEVAATTPRRSFVSFGSRTVLR